MGFGDLGFKVYGLGLQGLGFEASGSREVALGGIGVCLSGLDLQYILCLIYGSRVLGTLNWDLRWIMTRALWRDTRGFSYRSVWLDPNIHLDSWSNAGGHQKVFRLRTLYTKHIY